MEVIFKTKKLERQCTISAETRKDLGLEMAEKVWQRIGELKSADSLEFMIQYGIGRCHPLHGARKDQYALDLVQPFRMIVIIAKEGVIQVECIENYH